jgi:hypothetical protein
MTYLAFITGIAVGIYIEQNYSIPKVRTILDKFSKEIKNYEKNEKKD